VHRIIQVAHQLKRRRQFISFILLAVASVPLFGADAPSIGITRFHQVNDRVYRGGQPSDKDWAGLAKLGIKTVIDLRPSNEHSTAAEQRAVEAAGMHYVNVPMHGVEAPSDENVAKVLSLFNSDSAGPVFVHCRRGADRTGTVIACYRISHDHWQNPKALQEARSLGMSWVEFGMQRYVLEFVGARLMATAASSEQPAVPTTSTP
jgi:tyrosine-protein phosphatase SIW14